MGCLTSHEITTSQGRSPWEWTNATRAAPLREVPSPCRGRRTHHVQKDCVGNWEIPRLTIGKALPWSASGKRGAVADDARAREVGPRNRSCEAGEQGGANRCGAGGAKAGGRGECEPAKHAPGTGPGKRVTGAGAHTECRKAKEGGKVHLAHPPHQHRHAADGVLRAKAGRCTGRGRSDVAGLRSRP